MTETAGSLVRMKDRGNAREKTWWPQTSSNFLSEGLNGWWLLRLSTKILALSRLSVTVFFSYS